MPPRRCCSYKEEIVKNQPELVNYLVRRGALLRVSGTPSARAPCPAEPVYYRRNKGTLTASYSSAVG